MVALYAATLFLSALLLFLVQPMVGKMVLPALGGTPAIWNTCVVFFQSALLIGYAYVCWITTRLSLRRQALLQMVVLFLPLMVLPIGPDPGSRPPAEGSPIAWLLSSLLLAVGLPFFVVATSSPLLQRWFAETDHPASRDPYFLYVASSLGSLVALLAYPILIEPRLRLASQTRLWTAGYAALIGMTATCAVIAVRRALPRAADGLPRLRMTPQRRTSSISADSAAPAVRRRLRWMLLAMAPSSLMLGVTTHITTNLAAVPLLWVIPLALYLLTFAIAFARRPWVSHDRMSKFLPVVATVSGPLFFVTIPGLEWRSALVHLMVFFVAAMTCHGQLAVSRPDPRHLAGYYLCVSLGGALGGAFNAILAPLVFRTVIEYPLMMAVACMLRPSPASVPYRSRARQLDVALPLALGVVAIGLVLFLRTTAWSGTWAGLAMVFVVVATACLAFRNRPLRFAFGYALGLTAFGLYARLEEGNLLHVERNFFGVKRVVSSEHGRRRELYHGTTLHGLQRTEPGLVDEPLAYYHRSGPVGDVFAATHARHAVSRVAVVGLGVGAMACYARPGERFDFHEIDPRVAAIAADAKYFTYLQRCKGTCEIVLGDGRQTLARAAAHRYNIIFLDAYSSDAIPTHLLSREAVRLYLDRLANDGLLAFHITNRYLRLEPLLAALGADAGLVCRARAESPVEIPPEAAAAGATPAHVVVMARRTEDLGLLATHAAWRTPPVSSETPVWTDQYSNIMAILRWD